MRRVMMAAAVAGFLIQPAMGADVFKPNTPAPATFGPKRPAPATFARGILLESKDGSSGFGNLRQRLGRSPGKGDAVVMAWSEGNAAAVSRQRLEVGKTASPMDRVNATNLEAASRLQQG